MDTTTAWVRGGILSQAAWTFLDDRHRPKLFLNLSVCVCVLRTFKIWALNNFEVYTIVLLTIITMLYVRSPGLIDVLVASLFL